MVGEEFIFVVGFCQWYIWCADNINIQLDAPCSQGQIHHDCYQKSCEPTCENIKTSDTCLTSNPNVCFPGCFCPAGLVKNGNKCIKPTKCQNCK